MPIQEDQLARKDNQTFVFFSVKCLVAVIKQLRQLARIGRGRRVLQLASRIECYSCFRRIWNDETYLRLFCQFHKSGKVRIRIQCAAYHIDPGKAVDFFTFVQPLKIDMIQAILCVQHVDHSPVDGLDHHDTAVKIYILVHFLDNPIHECPEEIAFSELDDPFRMQHFTGSFFIQLFHFTIYLKSVH